MTTLQGCFECTDWSVFREAATKDPEVDIEESVETVSGYIGRVGSTSLFTSSVSCFHVSFFLNFTIQNKGFS